MTTLSLARVSRGSSPWDLPSCQRLHLLIQMFKLEFQGQRLSLDYQAHMCRRYSHLLLSRIFANIGDDPEEAENCNPVRMMPVVFIS